MGFADLADVFDLMADPTRLAREVPGLRRFLGSASALLDIGCGSGEHLAEIAAETTLEATGIDPEPCLIAMAQRRLPQGTFLLGDAFTDPGQRFPRISLLGNVLGCQRRHADLLPLLCHLRDLLTPGGRLLIQIPNGDQPAPPPRTVVKRSAAGDRLFTKLLCASDQVDLLSAHAHVRQADQTWQHATHQQTLLRIPSSLLIDHATRAGFQDIACHGDCDGQPFEPDSSPQCLFTATNPGTIP